MNSKNIQNLIFGTPPVYLMFLFCVGLTHAQRVDVVDHLGNKAKTGTVVTKSVTSPDNPRVGDIWINTSKTPKTTNIWDGNDWTEVKPSYQSVSQDSDTHTKIQLEETDNDDTIRFDTGGEERMVITDEGNVGIGTSSPLGELHLSKSAPDADVCARIQNNTLFETGDDGKRGSTATLRFSVTPDSRFDSAFVGSDRTNSLILGSNDDERMRIDEYGNVGIGRVPSEFRDGFHALQVGGDQGNGITLLGNDASIGTGYYLARETSEKAYFYDNSSKAASMLKMSDEDFSFSIAKEKEGGLENEIEWKEIMKIEDYTAPIITTTAANGDSGLRLKIVGGGNQILRIQDGNDNDKDLMTIDKDGNLSVKGTITPNSSATTSYNTSSDQRLKENIVDAPSASDDIDAIQVRSFDWKTDGSHQKYGMIAQELQTVAPEAVSGDADSEDMMGVDYSKLVPMLIKEIQSLRKRVEQLETN